MFPIGEDDIEPTYGPAPLLIPSVTGRYATCSGARDGQWGGVAAERVAS
jgi:hypothetical protein